MDVDFDGDFGSQLSAGFRVKDLDVDFDGGFKVIVSHQYNVWFNYRHQALALADERVPAFFRV